MDQEFEVVQSVLGRRLELRLFVQEQKMTLDNAIVSEFDKSINTLNKIEPNFEVRKKKGDELEMSLALFQFLPFLSVTNKPK